MVRIIALANENVLAAPFSNFNRQGQNLFPLGRLLRIRGDPSSGFWRSSRRTLLVLPLLLYQLLLLILRQALEVKIL